MNPCPRVLACLVVLTVSRAAAQTPPGFTQAWRPVAETFHSALAREGVVGGSLWFVRGDSVLVREFHGKADQATGRPVDANTIYHWASITKTLTAIGIMQLRDRGR